MYSLFLNFWKEHLSRVRSSPRTGCQSVSGGSWYIFLFVNRSKMLNRKRKWLCVSQPQTHILDEIIEGRNQVLFLTASSCTPPLPVSKYGRGALQELANSCRKGCAQNYKHAPTFCEFSTEAHLHSLCISCQQQLSSIEAIRICNKWGRKTEHRGLAFGTPPPKQGS